MTWRSIYVPKLRLYVLAGSLVTAAAIGFSLVSRPDKSPIPTARAVIVSLAASGSMVYDCREAKAHELACKTRLDGPIYLGYSESHSGFVVVHDPYPYTAYRIVLVMSDRDRIIYTGDDEDVGQSVFRAETLYVPKAMGNSLILMRYGLDGVPKRSIRLSGLSVAKLVLDNHDKSIDVAANGMIAAALVPPSAKSAPSICLFNKDGRLLSRSWLGYSPRLSRDGRYLAYRWPTDTGRIVIRDLRTKRTLLISAAKPNWYYRWYGLASDLLDYRMAPDGKSLVCSYVRGFLVQSGRDSAYLVDLSHSRPEWHRLPVSVTRGWNLLDELPGPLLQGRTKTGARGG